MQVQFAVALIDNDEVEEVVREFFEQPKVTFVFGQRLVDCEIHLATFDNLPAFEFVPGITEGGEDTVLRLINENVAVGQIRADQSFSKSGIATTVLPVPVAIVRRGAGPP